MADNPLFKVYDDSEQALQELNEVAEDIFRYVRERYGPDYRLGNMIIVLAILIAQVSGDSKNPRETLSDIVRLSALLLEWRLREGV